MERRGSSVLRTQVRVASHHLCALPAPGPGLHAPLPTPRKPPSTSVQAKDWEGDLVPAGWEERPGPAPLSGGGSRQCGGPRLRVTEPAFPSRLPHRPHHFTSRAPEVGEGEQRGRSPPPGTSIALAQGPPSLHAGKAQHIPQLTLGDPPPFSLLSAFFSTPAIYFPRRKKTGVEFHRSVGQWPPQGPGILIRDWREHSVFLLLFLELGTFSLLVFVEYLPREEPLICNVVMNPSRIE